jgi:hypothetical protein
LIMGRSENAKKMNENNIINYREKEWEISGNNY